MANFTRANPSGWADEDLLTHTQANDIDEKFPKIPNFTEGSSHTPTAPVIVLGDEGLQVHHMQMDREITRYDSDAIDEDEISPYDLSPVRFRSVGIEIPSRIIRLDYTEFGQGEMVTVVFKTFQTGRTLIIQDGAFELIRFVTAGTGLAVGIATFVRTNGTYVDGPDSMGLLLLSHSVYGATITATIDTNAYRVA